VAEAVVDDLEAIEIEEQHREVVIRWIALVALHGLGEPIVEQHAIGQPGEAIVQGELGQLAGALLHHVLELIHLELGVEAQGPFFAEGDGELIDLDGVEGFLEDQQAIGEAELGRDLLPGVVGVSGADDDLEIRIDGPEALDGLKAVPAGGHAHVHERDRVGAFCLEGGLQLLEALLALEGRVELEGLSGAGTGCRRGYRGVGIAEERGLCSGKPAGSTRRSAAATVCGSPRRSAAGEDLLEIAVDGLVVVDDEDAPIALGHSLFPPPPRVAPASFTAAAAAAGDVAAETSRDSSRLIGNSRVKAAPRPTPSLVAVRSPPISRAALAAL
jgi:hypothetical protein